MVMPSWGVCCSTIIVISYLGVVQSLRLVKLYVPQHPCFRVLTLHLSSFLASLYGVFTWSISSTWYLVHFCLFVLLDLIAKCHVLRTGIYIR
jgi:hypothetical protein